MLVSLKVDLLSHCALRQQQDTAWLSYIPTNNVPNKFIFSDFLVAVITFLLRSLLLCLQKCQLKFCQICLFICMQSYRLMCSDLILDLTLMYLFFGFVFCCAPYSRKKNKCINVKEKKKKNYMDALNYSVNSLSDLAWCSPLRSASFVQNHT